jgi:hypothetical protein
MALSAPFEHHVGGESAAGSAYTFERGEPFPGKLICEGETDGFETT